MSVELLLVKYMQGEALRPAELRFLRANLSRAKLEALATGPAGRSGGSRRLYKLWNLLFASKTGPKKPRPSAAQPRTVFPGLKPPGPDQDVTVVSGGGVNSTGKRR